jgi:TPP-dependent pyruvate/acetoin dehydrogenase alpha subunit
MTAELFGPARGALAGSSGSTQIADPDLGMLGASDIVGSVIPLAVGAAVGVLLLRGDPGGG